MCSKITSLGSNFFSAPSACSSCEKAGNENMVSVKKTAQIRKSVKVFDFKIELLYI
jgi:hypothetical protein